MGFPVGYSELLVPRLLLNVVFVLGFIRTAVCWLLRFMGLGDFLETEVYWPDQANSCLEASSSIYAQRIREWLPIVRFGVLAEEAEVDDAMCAVCLNSVERHEEIRILTNCSHIFHRGCLDKWVDHDQRTCPLCRSPFLSNDTETEMKEELMRTLDQSSNLFV